MPVGNFSITELIPELQAGLIKYITDIYDETHGYSKMANEARPQNEQKIHLMGKTFNRFVATDIPQRGKVGYVKDTLFTDDFKTAPEYGRGFTINVDDLMLNSNMPVNFNSLIQGGRGATLSERVNVASRICVEEIRRAEDMQVKNILETATVSLTNYTAVDFGRDTDLSTSITTSTLKWTIANKSTMTGFEDLEDWAETLVTVGNSSANEIIGLFGDNAYSAFINSDEFLADSDIRRNYKIERLTGISASMNKNIPEGAVYRTSINLKVGILHIFTYSQNYMVSAGVTANWLDKNMVILIAPENIIERQPVIIPHMMELMPMSNEMRALIRTIPGSGAWLIHPDWKECDMFTFAMNIRKQFLTMPLTPNKIFSAIVNS